MANPLYGSNKEDDILAALSKASDDVNTSPATGSGKVGAASAAADACVPITINGVEYVLALYVASKAS